MRPLHAQAARKAPAAEPLPRECFSGRTISTSWMQGKDCAPRRIYFRAYKEAGGKLTESQLWMLFWGTTYPNASWKAGRLNEFLGKTLSQQEDAIAQRLFMHVPFMELQKVKSDVQLRSEFLHELGCLMQASRFD